MIVAGLAESWIELAGRSRRSLQSRLKWNMQGELRILFSLVAGAVVGWLTWGRGESVWGLAGLLVLPLVWGTSRSRWEGLALMLAYYLAGARGLPGGAVVFFGDAAPRWWGLAMWLGASSLLCMPFALCWSRVPARRASGFLLALFVCLMPPLGIVGWLNPLSVAGILFPSGGWLGLAMAVALHVVLVLRKWRLIATLGLAAALANAGAWHSDASTPNRWLGFDTAFSKLSSAGTDQASQLLASIGRIEWLRRVIAEMPANVTLVLPETVLGRYDGVAQTMLSQAEAELVAKNSRVLVGAELPGDNARYKNAVVVLGAQQRDDRAAIQGIPVPISMWKPWSDDGAHADLLARASTIMVDGSRVGVSICYEQLLAFSMLRLMADKPDVIAAVSNVWWARSTNIPVIQFQSVHVFARLFNVPVIAAKNI